MSFCRTDPEIAKAFARVTFTSDNRTDLPKVSVPTLILQCKEDIIASMEVGEFVHRQIPGSKMVVMPMHFDETPYANERGSADDDQAMYLRGGHLYGQLGSVAGSNTFTSEPSEYWWHSEGAARTDGEVA